MSKYRIKKYEYINAVRYEAQKKVWYFPFWYNFNNIDAHTTGVYNTEIEARIAIEENKHKTKKTIIKVN